MKAVLIDDEPLALKRLARLIRGTGRVEIVAQFTDPVEAVEFPAAAPVDLLFLDIEMPGMNAFEVIEKLDYQPLVIFTTAYSQYALRAFEVNSIDYLVKPIEVEQLERALSKLERILGADEPRPDLTSLLNRLSDALGQRGQEFPSRIASRLGDRVEFIELKRVTHFFAKDKLTYAAAIGGKAYVVDHTITDLERKLDPASFIRIHRSTIVNVASIKELYTWFGGRLLVRLTDDKRTELTVARDRARQLKQRLGI